ncbi:uncharacterized protein METZ01_LOCUS500300, partial [marine metagenome]
MALIESSGVIDNPLVEFVIVDNFSEDKIFINLKKLVLKYSNIRLFRNEANIGMVRNWNECIIRAEGEWLLLMCSDDLFVSGSIIDIIDFINNHVDEPSLIIQDPLAVKPFIKKAPGAKTVQSINLPIASGNMWHKSISSALGGFDNRL